MATLLDIRQFDTYVSACANEHGVVVTWDDPTSTPRTDGKHLWLPKITSSTSDEWLVRMRYYVKHETSHVVHSDFAFLNAKKPKGLLALINNLIEDHRIDYRNDKEYRGDGAISNDYWAIYAGDIEARATSEDKELSEQQLLTLPLFIWESDARDWIMTSGLVNTAMRTLVDTTAAERLSKLASYSDELMRVRESGGAGQVWDLSVKILREVFEQEEEDCSGEDAQAEGGGSGKEGEDGEEGVGLADDVDRLVKVDKLLSSLGHEHTSSRTGLSFTGEFDKYGDYIMPLPKDYVICKTDNLPPCIAKYIDRTTYFKKGRVLDFITSNAHHLSNKLRIKLQTRSRDRYEYGKKRGKLHNGSLHRVLSSDDKQASRIFRQRVVSDTTDTAVCLLVDCSGSMSGQKFEMACAGAGAFAEALRPLNIPFSVYGFTNTIVEDNPVIWLFNEFGERVSTTELVSRFSIAAGALWENTDGDAVAYAQWRLLQRKEKRKVMIVLSDGSPNGRDSFGNIAAYTLKAVKTAENSGIDVYGVGIKDRNVERFYTKNVVVNDLDELAPTILSIVDRSM